MAMPVMSESLTARIEEIRLQQGDAVSVDEVADVVVSLMATLEGDISAADLKIHRELDELVRFIQRAKAELAAIEPAQISAEQITPATDELDAVIAATEEATGKFLESAEIIETVACTVDEEAALALRGVATRIYEASTFQDITGQRISKVVAALRHIEAKIERIALVAKGQAVPEEEAVAGELPDDADMLNGPALPGDTNSQDDIDALLASFD